MRESTDRLLGLGVGQPQDELAHFRRGLDRFEERGRQDRCRVVAHGLRLCMAIAGQRSDALPPGPRKPSPNMQNLGRRLGRSSSVDSAGTSAGVAVTPEPVGPTPASEAKPERKPNQAKPSKAKPEAKPSKAEPSKAKPSKAKQAAAKPRGTKTPAREGSDLRGFAGGGRAASDQRRGAPGGRQADRREAGRARARHPRGPRVSCSRSATRTGARRSPWPTWSRGSRS